MKEYFQHLGRVGIAGAAVAASAGCTPESEYIKGTVVNRNNIETVIETRPLAKGK